MYLMFLYIYISAYIEIMNKYCLSMAIALPPMVSIFIWYKITNITSPSASELECLPWDWEVVGSTPGRISAVIYCQSPRSLEWKLEYPVSGYKIWQGHPDNKVKKEVKYNQRNK